MNKNFFVASSRTSIKLPLRRTLVRSGQWATLPIKSINHHKNNYAAIPLSFGEGLGMRSNNYALVPLSFGEGLGVRSTFLFIFFLLSFTTQAQPMQKKQTFTHADTLRGSLNENRDWWDVLRYDITVKPDYEKKEIQGKTDIYFRVISKEMKNILQIDLQEPLVIDSIIGASEAPLKLNGSKIEFTKQDGVYLIGSGWFDLNDNARNVIIKEAKITIFYHGKPKEAIRPPWDGGWIWKKDKQGNPWMSVAVQGLGASAWYPCKDYQGDEPNNGASLTMIVPDTLMAVANGRLITQSLIPNSKLHSYTWQVTNPINNYNIVPYIGKYVNFTDTLMGEKGKLDLSYWVLNYNVEKAKEQFKQVKQMLRAFEYWFGPYPFYEDSYKLVEAPHLGMEHQSAVAYGNGYQNGYLGRDRSSSGWGLKWDYIIIHESGHEWFANNITTKDIADMWVHESFTTYGETLFAEFYYGIQAGNEYNYAFRKEISNKVPIIGTYGVNRESDAGLDIYFKGSSMLHTIRHAINDDEKFRQILRGLNKTYYHQTVTTKQIEDYISKQAGFNFSKIFDQYLRTIQIPILEFKWSSDKKKVSYRWTNCVAGFNLPLIMMTDVNAKKILPTTVWQTLKVNAAQSNWWNENEIVKLYYVGCKEVK